MPNSFSGAATPPPFSSSVEVVRRLRLAPGDDAVMLGAHVLYLRQLQHAVLLRLVERVAGGVGVHVHLERLVVLADDKAVADAVEERAVRREVDVGIGLAHDEHRVEGESYVLRVENVKGALPLVLDLDRAVGGDDLPAQGGEDRAEYDHVALAARVDDARLFQHGVEVYRVGQRVVSGGDGAFKRMLQRGTGVRRLCRRLGREAGYGEYGAFGGLHDRLVRRVNTVVERAGKFHRARGLHALEALCDAAEQQRQYNAGVAARAAQQFGRNAVRRLVDGCEAALSQLVGGVVEREAHIRAGVAVRHRENVQLVYLLYICVERRVRAQYHLFERGGVDIIFQVKVPPGAYPIIVSI